MAKIRVSGTVHVQAYYEVELPVTEEQFDAMSERQQNELIEDHIDWYEVLKSSETDEIDVDDLVVLEEGGLDGEHVGK